MVSPQSLVVGNGPVTVADIGCDHAYVSIALAGRGLAERVIAMDVRKGPLQIAAQNVLDYGMDKEIELRLSDGMEKLLPGEAEIIVIAGMGGLLMQKILDAGRNVWNGSGKTGCSKPGGTVFKRPVFVLQPQSDTEKVREFLLAYEYDIEREQWLIDEGKYYTVIRAVPIEQHPKQLCQDGGARMEEKYSGVELRYGKYGLQNRDVVLYKFLQREYEVLERITENLEKAVADAGQEKRDIPQKTMERLLSVKEEQHLNQMAFDYFM